MGLFDKLKNIFIEEEFEEDNSIPKVKEPIVEKETIANNSIKNEEIVETNKDVPPVINDVSDRTLVDTKENFKFPIFFEDDDFKEEKKKAKSVNVLERESTKYNKEVKKEIKPQKKVFKPSLVISPVYGVLDKNYSKEDVKSKDGLLNDSEEKIDIDYVINKAYGKTSEIPINEIQESEEASIDLFKEKENYELEEHSMEEMNDKMKSIDELLKDTNDDDFYSLVDSMYKDEEEGEIEE